MVFLASCLPSDQELVIHDKLYIIVFATGSYVRQNTLSFIIIESSQVKIQKRREVKLLHVTTR